jgi:hypothetical protein
MLVTEQDLLTFQICPRKYFLSRTDKDEETEQLVTLQQFIAIWMWTYEVIHKQKCSFTALKEKWAHTVTKSHVRMASKHTLLSPVGETIAAGFPLVSELYSAYIGHAFKPAATMLPVRLTIPHTGVVKVSAQAVGVNDLGNTVLLNYSTDSSTHDTVTNLVHQVRLAAAFEELGATQLVSYRLGQHLPVSYIRMGELDLNKLRKNLTHVILAIREGIDYPILNCKLSCKYRDICY